MDNQSFLRQEIKNAEEVIKYYTGKLKHWQEIRTERFKRLVDEQIKQFDK